METTSALRKYWEARDQEPDQHPSYVTLAVFSSTLKMPQSGQLKAHIRECAVCRQLVEEKAIGAPKN